MDFWQTARGFAEEAVKRSRDLTKEAAKRSQDLTLGPSRFSEVFSETAKRSKELASEASNRAEQIRIEAVKHADQIKCMMEGVSPSRQVEISDDCSGDLERYGITEELRDFVKGITITTFQDFPLEDDSQVSDIPTVLNVRQDLTEWQTKHANLVLSSVKEISKLRYELCPRVMKERKFWRIYFILMNRHVAPYEKKYMEEIVLKSSPPVEEDSRREVPNPEIASVSVVKGKTTTTTSTDQDLDVFLLGDEDSDGPDIGDEIFDDDFDKMIDSSDDEEEKFRK